MFKTLRQFGSVMLLSFIVLSFAQTVNADAYQDYGPLKDGQSGTTTEDEGTKPPTIPQISTLPRPGTSDVTQISSYLTSNFLPRVARTIVSLAIGISVLGLIVGSIQLLTAYGNEEKYGNGKKAIYFSLIGLIISLLSFAIVQVIFFTGFQIGQIK